MLSPQDPPSNETSIAERVRNVASADLAAAESLIQSREREAPSDPSLLAARGFVRLLVGDGDGAEALFSRRLSLGPDPSALIGLAHTLLPRGRIAEIAEPLARHEGIDAPDVHMSRFFPRAYVEGRSPGAEDALARCLEKDRQYAIAQVGLALLGHREHDRSRTLLAWGLEIRGAAPDIHGLAAHFARGDRDFIRAAREIEHFRALGGSAASAAYMEGTLLLSQSRRVEALERYALAASLRPGWTLALREAGKLARRLRRWDEVERFGEEIAANDPVDGAAMRFVAAFYQGQPLKALRALRKPSGVGKV